MIIDNIGVEQVIGRRDQDVGAADGPGRGGAPADEAQQLSPLSLAVLLGTQEASRLQ